MYGLLWNSLKGLEGAFGSRNMTNKNVLSIAPPSVQQMYVAACLSSGRDLEPFHQILDLYDYLGQQKKALVKEYKYNRMKK